jgi:aryl-phospho-beta-D-glucosidase BglC (GH1 family)
MLLSLLSHLNHFLYTHNPPLPNFIGIELLNEPHPGSDTALQLWYATTIQKLRSIDATVPLYLGECWRLDTYADWLVKTKINPGQGLTIFDHHLYRCFTSSDITTSASAHSKALDPEASGDTARHFSSVSEKLGRVGSGLVIGEWSGALNPGSLHGSTSGGWKETKQYIAAQLRLYDQTCAGWFFWTFKKQQPGDSGWSLRDAIGAGTFPDRVGVKLATPEGGVDINAEEIFKAKSQAKLVAAGQWHSSILIPEKKIVFCR